MSRRVISLIVPAALLAVVGIGLMDTGRLPSDVQAAHQGERVPFDTSEWKTDFKKHSISLADIELLKIKIRLLVASVDKAKEIGIDWWEGDPALSSRARHLEKENEELRARVQQLEPR